MGLTWLLWLGLALSLLAICATLLSAYGAAHWTVTTRRLAARLEAGRAGANTRLPTTAWFDPRELEGLPAPVQRYFRAVLKDGQALIAAVQVDLAGSFNLSATAEQWKPFRSRQSVVAHRPGFLWDARVSIFPGLAVRVYDGYIAGEGLLRAAVVGLFRVADLHGGGEIARGELMRFFAEMPWYPTALLPSEGVRWAAIDDHSANATILDGPLALTLRFNFNDVGLIESVRAEARGAMLDKQLVMLPWEGRWSDYQMRDGMMVPINGEAAWLRPEGRRAYFRGKVTSLSYEFSSTGRPRMKALSPQSSLDATPQTDLFSASAQATSGTICSCD